MNTILVLPIIIPLFAASASLLCWRNRGLQRAFGLCGAAGLVVSSSVVLAAAWQGGIQHLQVGNWPAPFGITLVADLFGAIMVLLAGVIGMAVVVFSWAQVGEEYETFHYWRER